VSDFCIVMARLFMTRVEKRYTQFEGKTWKERRE